MNSSPEYNIWGFKMNQVLNSDSGFEKILPSVYYIFKNLFVVN